MGPGFGYASPTPCLVTSRCCCLFKKPRHCSHGIVLVLSLAKPNSTCFACSILSSGAESWAHAKASFCRQGWSRTEDAVLARMLLVVAVAAGSLFCRCHVERHHSFDKTKGNGKDVPGLANAPSLLGFSLSRRTRLLAHCHIKAELRLRMPGDCGPGDQPASPRLREGARTRSCLESCQHP